MATSYPSASEDHAARGLHADPLPSAVTVLVVEDEPDIANAIANRLAAEGWTAEIAGDGLTAVDAGEHHVQDDDVRPESGGRRHPGRDAPRHRRTGGVPPDS